MGADAWRYVRGIVYGHGHRCTAQCVAVTENGHWCEAQCVAGTGNGHWREAQCVAGPGQTQNTSCSTRIHIHISTVGSGYLATDYSNRLFRMRYLSLPIGKSISKDVDMPDRDEPTWHARIYIRLYMDSIAGLCSHHP